MLLLRRCLSTVAPTHSVYLSRAKNPYVNLAFEDWLFRRAPEDAPVLFIYRNEPCVVIGRNQNPWKEVNLSALHRNKVSLVRRRSGGGTDLGNTNFSIHLPREIFDRKNTANIVLRAVREIGIPAARVNDRNDIYVSSNKISSAYKIVAKRAYHHGTMLLSSRLDLLGDILHVNKPTMQGSGVASVRAPVTNLRSFSDRAEHDLFSELLVEQFRRVYESDGEPQFLDEEQMLDIEEVRSMVDELQTWDWLYGQTPQFTYSIQHKFQWGSLTADISSKHGRILSLALSGSDTPPALEPVLRDLESASVDQMYGGSWPVVEKGDIKQEARVDIKRWLAGALR
ncbi:Lipoyltransferase/lipoate-protein ligase [Mycena chlorophos]|uniref:Putative lipoate-protein ligase A n=1 Tax=Mycena chlorophos TaxID=658473 RepID=A0A8H6VUB3_MYCCL|nr:Lipoyltransferase/lipoate-protein ligase [Mycena chlorophos]